jgi:hypothetical protein
VGLGLTWWRSNHSGRYTDKHSRSVIRGQKGTKGSRVEKGSGPPPPHSTTEFSHPGTVRGYGEETAYCSDSVRGVGKIYRDLTLQYRGGGAGGRGGKAGLRDWTSNHPSPASSPYFGARQSMDARSFKTGIAIVSSLRHCCACDIIVVLIFLLTSSTRSMITINELAEGAKLAKSKN